MHPGPERGRVVRDPFLQMVDKQTSSEYKILCRPDN